MVKLSLCWYVTNVYPGETASKAVAIKLRPTEAARKAALLKKIMDKQTIIEREAGLPALPEHPLVRFMHSEKGTERLEGFREWSRRFEDAVKRRGELTAGHKASNPEVHSQLENLKKEYDAIRGVATAEFHSHEHKDGDILSSLPEGATIRTRRLP